MIIDASADALYRSAGSGAWRGRAFWLCLVHRFVNSCTDPQTSEWYSYFKNDVPVHKMYGLGCTDYQDPGKLQDQKEASGERYELYLYTPLRRRDIVLRMDQ